MFHYKYKKCLRNNTNGRINDIEKPNDAFFLFIPIISLKILKDIFLAIDFYLFKVSFNQKIFYFAVRQIYLF